MIQDVWPYAVATVATLALLVFGVGLLIWKGPRI